jgi:hypothetical protein
MACVTTTLERLALPAHATHLELFSLLSYAEHIATMADTTMADTTMADATMGDVAAEVFLLPRLRPPID